MENSKIEWTHHTFNPWVGCTKVSPGCDHCYAETLVSGRFKKDVWGAGKPRERTSVINWRQPVIWNKKAAALGERHRVFCASLSDVFDNEVPEDWRADLFDLIKATPHLDWLLLTKRIGNAYKMLPWVREAGDESICPWPNVWLGASIVNQKEADRDIPTLISTPARIHFLSMEPLLGSVNLSGTNHFQTGLIDWVIVGGESGKNARPMHPQWVYYLRDQCLNAGVPFLFKQWGEYKPVGWVHAKSTGAMVRMDGYIAKNRDELSVSHNFEMELVGKKEAGRLLDGKEYNEVPVC